MATPKQQGDFSQPASDIAKASLLNSTTGSLTAGIQTFPRPATACLPNTNNNPQLTQAQVIQANQSMQNFIKDLKWPPITSGDRDKMKAAIKVYKDKIQQLRKASTKKAKGGQSAPPAELLLVKKLPIGIDPCGVTPCLPPGTNLQTTSYDTALGILTNTVAQMETYVQPQRCTMPPAPDPTTGGSAPGFRATEQG